MSTEPTDHLVTGPSPVEQADEVGLTEAEREFLLDVLAQPQHKKAWHVEDEVCQIIAARLAARDTADAAALARVEAAFATAPIYPAEQTLHVWWEWCYEVKAALKGDSVSGSAQDRAAEVLAEHALLVRPDGTTPYRCACAPGNYWSTAQHSTHVAQALADAGLLGDPEPEVEGDEREALARLLYVMGNSEGRPERERAWDTPTIPESMKAARRVFADAILAAGYRIAPAVPAPVGADAGLRAALEAEWFNGNMSEEVLDRLLAAHPVPDEPATVRALGGGEA